MPKVPLLDLSEQNHPLEEKFTQAFQSILRSNQFIMGPELEKFENAVAEYLGVEHAIGVSSGTDALLLALMAIEDLQPGDEMLCPTFTFFATAGCIARAGLTPVWVDVCPVCFNMDIADAAKKIGPRTKAIMPVHLFGQAAEMNELQELASERGLHVIEDAAQAIGAQYRGKYVGTLGDFGCFSFFPTKNLGGMGDSGMVVTNRDDLAHRARILRVHGMEPKYYHKFIGANFRMDPLQAAMLSIKLPHLDSYAENRRRNAAYYIDQLVKAPNIRQASETDCCCPLQTSDGTPSPAGGETGEIILPVAYSHNTHIWNQFTLRVIGKGRRDALRQHLLNRDIGCEIYYPVTLDQQECFDGIGRGAEGKMVAHQLAEEVLALPIFPELREEHLAAVVDAIIEF